MTGLVYSTDPREIARMLEDRETRRLGKLSVAREKLARKLACAPGTLENLRKGRLKRIEVWFQRKLETLLVHEIEREIRRLNRELEAHRRAGGDLASTPEFARLVEAVAVAQRLIEATRIPTTGEVSNGEA